MLNRCALALLACIALLSWQAPAQAQTEGLPIGWAWSMADGELTLTLEGFDQMEDLRVRVTRTPSRQVYTFDRSTLGLGQQWDVQFPAPDRTSRFAIRVDADFAGEAGFIEDGFEIEVLAPMDFEVDLDSFEADARRFSMTMTVPADYRADRPWRHRRHRRRARGAVRRRARGHDARCLRTRRPAGSHDRREGGGDDG